MANLNKVHLIGRLTRDPESKSFANGGKVVNFSLAITNRKKDASGGWTDDPCFLDCKVFNRGEGQKQADLIENSCRKGHQLYVEGALLQESWEKDGQKRSKIVVRVDNFQFLEKRGEGGDMSAPSELPPRQAPPPRQVSRQQPDYPAPNYDAAPGDDGIPF